MARPLTLGLAAVLLAAGAGECELQSTLGDGGAAFHTNALFVFAIACNLPACGLCLACTAVSAEIGNQVGGVDDEAGYFDMG
jgi:hypothetical protein